MILFFFFFNDTATTEIYTLSLHDALPIWLCAQHREQSASLPTSASPGSGSRNSNSAWDGSTAPRLIWSAECNSRLETPRDRKSTRLNSSHLVISYAVFCLKKKIRTCDIIT